MYRWFNDVPAFGLPHERKAVILNCLSITCCAWVVLMQLVSTFRRWRRAWRATLIVGAALL